MGDGRSLLLFQISHKSLVSRHPVMASEASIHGNIIASHHSLNTRPGLPDYGLDTAPGLEANLLLPRAWLRRHRALCSEVIRNDAALILIYAPLFRFLNSLVQRTLPGMASNERHVVK